MPSPPPPTSIPGVFLDPFLAVVRSPETSGPITTVALQALGRFCAAGLVVGAGAGRALNDLARAVVECRFDPTNAAMDEVVLSHILRTLRAAVTCTVGHTLSDEMVCEIMQTCFRLCFQVRVLFFFFFFFCLVLCVGACGVRCAFAWRLRTFPPQNFYFECFSVGAGLDWVVLNALNKK